MKKPLKSVVISLSSMIIILISTTQVSESCGWGPEGEDYRVALFASKILGDDVFQPFYYTSKMINADIPNFESDKTRNLKLWQKELGSLIEISDIDEILYQKDTEEVLTAFYEKRASKIYAKNTFVNALLKPKNIAIFEYFIIAKFNEYVNFIGYNGDKDPWNFKEEAVEKVPFDVPSRAKIMEIIDKSWAASNSNFLKQRYAYLQLVNYRYTNQGDKGMALFKKHFNKNNADIITAWAIFHAASCTKNKVEANYFLSLAFDKCDSKKVRCYYGLNRENLEETIAATENANEKATIYAMQGMNSPGRQMGLIQKVYSLSPRNPNLRVLVYREISKIEDWLLTSKITGMSASVQPKNDDSYGYDKQTKTEDKEPKSFRNEVDRPLDYFKLKNYEKDLVYTREFRSLLIELLRDETETAQQDFLKLAISHLYFIDDEPKEALKYNEMVSNNNAQTNIQQQINNILLLPLTNDISSESTKAAFAKSFRYLQNNLEDIHRPLRTISQLNLYLSKLYYGKGDLLTAAFLHQKSNFTAKQEWEGSDYYQTIAFFDRYATIEQIEEVIQFLDKKSPTTFDTYLLENYSLSFVKYIEKNKQGTYNAWRYKGNQDARSFMKLALIDLQGTIAFRQDDLKKALSHFEKLPGNYWGNNYQFIEYLTQNPFTQKDIWRIPENSPIKASKLEVVKKLLALKQKAESENNADAYFELANAYYNFTYHGNSWMMFSYGKYAYETSRNSEPGYGAYSFYPNGERYFEVYYGCDRAKGFYQKAVDTAMDNVELEARAAMMVEFCKEKKQSVRNSQAGKNVNFSDGYLYEWSRKYNKTQVYRKSNCLPVNKLRKKEIESIGH
jgi:hypothetical protein